MTTQETDTVGITESIAKWVVRMQTATLPADVEHHVRRLMVDYFAGVIASSQTEVSQAVGRHVAQHYQGEASTAIGLGKVSALGAAFMNGTSAHGLEVDDGYTPGSVHPSSVAFPPVLAVAQAVGADRDTTLKGIAVALELTCRIAGAGHPATWRNHFHNTPISGVMAGTAGVAVVLGLNETQVLDALGIAGSHVGGLFAFLGQSAEVKRVHPGKASRDAIVSAELAQAGVTGPRDIFEGAHGYIDAFARGEFDREGSIKDLGESWATLGTYVKPYPSCRHLHAPIDAVLALREEHNIDATDITGIAVKTHTVASHHNSQNIESFLDAQMSIPYAVAVAALNGEVGLTEFDEMARQNPEVKRLTQLSTVEIDPACDEVYPIERPAVVTITTSRGSTFERRVGQPYGEPSNPVSDADITGKFLRLTVPYIGDQAHGLAEQLWKFESLDIIDDVQQAVKGH